MRLKKIIWLAFIAMTIVYGGYLIQRNTLGWGWALGVLGSITFLLVLRFFHRPHSEPILSSLPNRFRYLGNRSALSQERKADALLGAATKLWSSIYLSLLIIPMLVIIAAAFFSPSASVSTLTMWNTIDTYLPYGAGIFYIYSLLVLFAHHHEQGALDLYDYVYRNYN